MLCLMLAAALVSAEPNPVFVELTKQGVVVEKGPALKLPAPTMSDGLDAEGQRKAIESIADANHPAEALLRKAVVAPLVLKVEDDEASHAGGGTGRRVDLWFVVYGDLKKIADEGLWSKSPDANKTTSDADDASKSDATGHALTEAELRGRKVELLSASGLTERYMASEFTLFDRVRLSTTLRTVQTQNDESTLFSAILDPRFTKDPQYPNQWRSVERDDDGKIKYGPPHPYVGAGAYAKATQLKKPAGAIFVEYHLAFDEPVGWFNGANLLRSKLPILAQDNVRKLRRKLAEK